jgi:hypothetical protein
MASRAGLKRGAALAAAVAALSLLAAYAYSLAREAGWLIAALTLAALFLRAALGALPQQPGRRVEAGRPRARVEALEKLVGQLPSSSGAVAARLRDLLLQRLCARTGLPVAEVEARAGELVRDEVLAKLLRGELRLESERDVLEVLDRIDGL